MRRSTWHVRAGAVVVAWMVALLAVGVASLVTTVTPWLVVHLLLLGAASNAILIWSRHFADALLRLPDDVGKRPEAMRLALFNIGAVAVVLGMVLDAWYAVVAGAIVVAGVAVWHAVVLLRRMRRSLPSRFGHTLRYYVAASLFLPVGVAIGVVMARDELSDPVHAQVALAHVSVNVLGWIGLTVVGTLVTLWPTMLHTLVADGAERAARLALPILVTGVVVSAAGALAGRRLGAAFGIVVYLLGLAVAARPLVSETRSKPPSTYATWSVLAAQAWFVLSVVGLALILLVSTGWDEAADSADRLAAPMLAGFGAQVLIGALSYLVPVVLGGGPAMTRATNAALDTFARTRLAMVNLGLIGVALALPQPAATVALVVLALGLASFLPLVGRAVLLSRSATPRQPA